MMYIVRVGVKLLGYNYPLNTHTHTHTHIHTHILTHTYTHTHTQRERVLTETGGATQQLQLVTIEAQRESEAGGKDVWRPWEGGKTRREWAVLHSRIFLLS